MEFRGAKKTSKQWNPCRLRVLWSQFWGLLARCPSWLSGPVGQGLPRLMSSKSCLLQKWKAYACLLQKLSMSEGAFWCPSMQHLHFSRPSAKNIWWLILEGLSNINADMAAACQTVKYLSFAFASFFRLIHPAVDEAAHRLLKSHPNLKVNLDSIVKVVKVTSDNSDGVMILIWLWSFLPGDLMLKLDTFQLFRVRIRVTSSFFLQLTGDFPPGGYEMSGRFLA